MIIGVNATALSNGGGLSILKQFLGQVTGAHVYYVFISASLELSYEGEAQVELIKIDTDTAVKRILWDWWGFRRWFKKRKLSANLTISLQNTSLPVGKGCKQIVYLHQGIPLHHKKWSFLKRKERNYAFYKYLYPFFIFLFVNKKTKFVVQTRWMKEALCRKFWLPEENVYVIKPDILRVDVEQIESIQLAHQYNLFYPASSALFKNHEVLIYALNEIKKRKSETFSIGLYLTIKETEAEDLLALIDIYNLQKNVHFLGTINYDEVLVYYKSCSVVVFPSYLESFGLPLLEAAMFAKPLVVADEEYSREVISAYEGVRFAMKNSPEPWCEAILQALEDKKELDRYNPVYDSNWSHFFNLVYESDGQS